MADNRMAMMGTNIRPTFSGRGAHAAVTQVGRQYHLGFYQ